MRNIVVGDVSFKGVFRNDLSPVVLKLTDNTNYTAAGEAQITQVVFRADVGGNLNNTYWYISSPTVNYYVWNDVAGAGTDPAVAGKTGIHVAFAFGATAHAVQLATDAVLVALGVFTAVDTVSGTSQYTNVIHGPGAAASADGAVVTGFTITTAHAGLAYTAISRGIYKITGPDGVVFYKNIGYDTNSFGPSYPTAQTADTYNWPKSPVPPYAPSFNVTLPLDFQGNILQGNYTIEYKVEDNAGVAIYMNQSFNYSHVIPVASIESNADCFASTIVSTDATNYNTPQGIYTLVLTRTHKLYYPQGLNRDPISVTGPLITISPIYDKTWTTTLNTIAVYSFTGTNFSIQDLIIGSQELLVNCDENLCGILCGLEKLNTLYLDSVTNGRPDRDLLFNKLNRITQLMNLFGNAQKCGQGTNADQYLQEIFTVGGFSADCGCGDSGEPKLIVPLYNLIGGSTVIVQAGTGILVAGVLSDGTMTYTVSLSSTYADKIAVLYNTSITSLDGTVTIVPSVVGDATIYDLHVAQSTAVADNSITTAMLQNVSVTAAKIAANSLGDAQMILKGISNLSIADATIGSGQMASNSITTAKIVNGAVTGAKIGAATIEEANMDSNSVGTTELINLCVTNAKIAAGAVQQGNLDPALFYAMVHYPVSFDVSAQNIAWPIDITPAAMLFNKIMIVVTKQTVGNCTVNLLANPGGAPLLATPFTIPLSTPVGTTYTLSGLLIPQVVSGGTFEIDAATSSPGGAAEVFVYYRKA